MSIYLRSVKCIVPSDGIDKIAPVVAAIGGGLLAGGVTVGAGVALSLATGGFAVIPMIMVAGVATAAGAAGGAIATVELDKKFSGTDELYIQLNGMKIWPEGSQSQDVKSQDKITLDYFLPDIDPCEISLREEDHSSGDDHLGSIKVPRDHSLGRVAYLVKSVSDKSIYEIQIEAIPDFPVVSNFDFATSRRYYSDNREFYLIYQTDGNLVVYKKDGTAIWALNSATGGKYKESNAAKFKDGNLMVTRKNYSGFRVTSEDVIWQTNTSGHPNAKIFLDQKTGVLSIIENNNPIWSSSN